MRSIQIQNSSLDPINVIRSTTTFGVTLGDYSAVDGFDDIKWCHKPQPVAPPCQQRKSNCSDHFHDAADSATSSTAPCECSDLWRRKFCSFCKSVKESFMQMSWTTPRCILLKREASFNLIHFQDVTRVFAIMNGNIIIWSIHLWWGYRRLTRL